MTAVGFWDRIAPKYATHPIADEAAYEHTLERTLSFLSDTDRVLELGAGTGTTALRIAPHVRELVATDVSPAMIAIAEDRLSGADVSNLRFEAASVGEALARDDSFDAILAFNLFHLIPDMEQRFSKIADRLTEGGVFISKTPCLSDRVQGLLRFALPLFLPVLRVIGKAPFVRRFTQAHLETAIQSAGFEIIEASNHPARARYIVARKR